MKDKKHSEYTRRLMSFQRKGIPHSEQHNINISKSKIGKKMPESVKIALLKANKGKIVSTKTRMKLSISHMHKTPWNKGLTNIFSHEALNKISETSKKLRKTQVLPVKDTSIEIKIQTFLQQLNISFLPHKHINIKHCFQCDVFIEPNIVIECDGDYWHNYPNGNDKDAVRTKEMQQIGLKVIRLWERDINAMSLNDFVMVLKNG